MSWMLEDGKEEIRDPCC